MTEDDIKNATAYLRANRELWAVLGIEDGSALEAVPLAQGEHNANYWFAHPVTGVRYVLRFNYISQLELENQSTYEFEVLQALEGSGRAPKALYVDDSKTLVPRGVLVMELVSGRMLDFERPEELAEAARMLADVHSVVPADDCPLLQPGDALADLVAECEKMFAIYRGSDLEDPVVTEYVERFFARARQCLAVEPRPEECRHIISCEMVSAHFLMNEDGAPGHIVDWEKAILGGDSRCRLLLSAYHHDLGYGVHLYA